MDVVGRPAIVLYRPQRLGRVTTGEALCVGGDLP